MAFINNYDEFIARVEELGFLPLSNILKGFPSLSNETSSDMWHTGLDTDPWLWKDRAANEKRLAYGCILGGHKGFVAASTYAIFYRAYHPVKTMPERWFGGELKQMIWQIWNLFEENITVNTSQIHKLVSGTQKRGNSQVDTCVQTLQKEYFITISGNERKVSADGKLYGWPSNVYTRVQDWAPSKWLDSINEWTPEDAKDTIVDEVVKISHNTNRREIQRVLKIG